MESIDRRQIERIILILRDVRTDESIKLANALESTDIIPKLYQAAYVESRYQMLKDKKPEDVNALLERKYDYFLAMIKDGNALEAVKGILMKAHDRQDEICDFADSTLPETKIGRCEYENHYELNEDKVKLTDEEQKIFDDLNEEEGWDEAWGRFEDRINPDNQTLRLTLQWAGDDETKASKDDGEYVCDTCMEEVNDCAEGGLSCDMEDIE